MMCVSMINIMIGTHSYKVSFNNETKISHNLQEVNNPWHSGSNDTTTVTSALLLLF